MGKFLSKIFGNKEIRILMLGLDAAGKTSILWRQTAGASVYARQGTGQEVEGGGLERMWGSGGTGKVGDCGDGDWGLDRWEN